MPRDRCKQRLFQSFCLAVVFLYLECSVFCKSPSVLCLLKRQAPVSKANQVVIDYIHVFDVPVNFQVRHPWQIYFSTSLPFLAWTVFFLRPTYASRFKASTDCRSPNRYLARSKIPIMSGFRNVLLQVGDFVIACRKASTSISFKSFLE